MEQIGQGLLEAVRLLQAGDCEVWSLAGPRLRSPTRANWPSGPHTKMGNCSNIYQYVFTPPSVFPRRRSNGKITLWESEPAVAMLTAHSIWRESSRVHSGMEWKIEVVGCSL